MARKLAKFVDEFVCPMTPNGWICAEARCLEYPRISRRVHTRLVKERPSFRQYFVRGRRLGFPNLQLAIAALRRKQ
jgi:hypothetical protein